MHLSNYTSYYCQQKSSKEFPYLKIHARNTHFWETKQIANAADSKDNEHRNRRWTGFL